MVFLFSVSIGTSDMKKANLTSQITGSVSLFTLPEPYAAGSLRVYYNGVRQVVNASFTETNATQFTLTFNPQSGDYVTVDYSPV